MAKNAVAGKVKSRLAADIGDASALRIYQALLQHTAQVSAALPCNKFVFYGDVVERNDVFDNALFKKYVQCSGDLGTHGIRLLYSF
ncbi:MAG: hypothetical protein R2794_10660 [Chitinophagales bacterium]